jgi:dihydroxy-acid dehydratase
MIDDATLTLRKNKMNAKGKDAWKPRPRSRKVSQALRAYALMTTSADKGAIRDISNLEEI